MGWQRDDFSDADHEGYLVAVERDGEGGWRELTYLLDGSRRTVVLIHVQIGCACGWRSPRVSAPVGTEWFPACVSAPEWFDDAAYDYWGSEHMDRLPVVLTRPMLAQRRD